MVLLQRRLTLLLLALASSRAVANTPAPTPPVKYFDYPADAEASALGRDKAAELCKDGFTGDDNLESTRDERKADMQDSIGDDNVMWTILSKSKNISDIPDAAKEELSYSWIASRAAPIVALIITLIIYSLMCWQCCPCCKCCRRCARKRSTHHITKLICIILYVGVICAILFLASFALAGFSNSKTGFVNIGCTGSKLYNETLNGASGFVGFMPLLAEIDALEKMLKPGSGFMTDIAQIIDQTMVIDTSFQLASVTLKLMSDSLTNPANLNPTAPDLTLPHKCVTCPQISESIAILVNQLDTSVAAGLKTARQGVKDTLAGGAGEKLAGCFASLAEPMQEIKNTVRDSLAGMVDGSLLEPVNDMLDGYGEYGVIGLLVWAILVSFCGLFACCSFLLCEKRKGVCTGEWEKKKQMNPYKKRVHRCASVTWCCGFPLLWLTLLICGLMVIMSTVLSGLCLIMDELQGSSLDTIGGALGVSLGNTTEMMYPIIDRCFNPLDGNFTASLLDVMTLPNDTEGAEPTPMRKIVIDDVKLVITKTFDDLSAKITGGESVKLAEQDEVVMLRKSIAHNPATTWIIPDTSSGSAYPALLASGVDAFMKVFATSLNCATHTPPPGEDMMGTLAIPGIDDIDAALASMGSTLVTSSYGCGNTVTCGDPLSDVCNEATEYIKQKMLLATTADVYRCDLFEDPADSSQYCDMRFMTGSSAAGYANDCGKCTDGVCTWKAKARYCDAKGYEDYIRLFDVRIDMALTRVDDATAQTMIDIDVKMRNTVNIWVIAAIDRFAGGMGCGFIGTLYRELIDGLCYQGVWGLIKVTEAYVGLAILLGVMIVIAYALWRRAVDNYNKWFQDNVVLM